MSAPIRVISAKAAPHRTGVVFANARTWGNKVEGRFILPGLISYRDVGQGVALLTKETIDRCVRTFEAKPFSIRHDAENVFTGEKMGDPSPENQEFTAVGYVSEVYFNPADGWYWFKGTIHNDDAKKKIDEGWGVSCTYVPTEAPGPGGVLNGVRYDYETRGFFGESIAIEPKHKIRYEGARISIVRNAKPNSGTTMNLFKIFKKKSLTDADVQTATDLEKQAKEAADKAAAIRNAKGDEFELTPETLVVVDDKGTQAKFGDIVAGYLDRARNAMTQIDPDSEVEYAPGKSAKMGVMCARYKQAVEDDEKAKNAKDEEEKQKAARNAEEERKKKEDEEKARNARPAIKLTHYDRVMNASERTTSDAMPTKRESTSSIEAQKARGAKAWSLPTGKN